MIMSEYFCRHTALAVIVLELCIAITAVEIWTIVIGVTHISYLSASWVIVFAVSGLVERIVLGLCLLCFYYRRGETQINDEKYIRLFIKRLLPLANVASWFRLGWLCFAVTIWNSDAYQKEKNNPELSVVSRCIMFVEFGWYWICIFMFMFVRRKAIIRCCRCKKNLDDDVIDMTSQTSPPV